MTDHTALAREIHDFLEKHAGTAANYDPDFDPPEERFSGPDSMMMWVAAERLAAGQSFTMPFTSWGSGCYHPYTDKEAEAWHDKLRGELRDVLAAEPSLKMR